MTPTIPLPPGWDPEKGHFVVENVFADPSPTAHINQRILITFINALEHTDLSEKEQEQVFHLLLLLAKKLAAAWRHLESYRQLEQRLVTQAQAEPANPAPGTVIHVDYSDDLFNDFDEFLVQLKSALDHLVKIPIPVFGGNAWKLRTFGDKGEEVINALQRNTPKKYADKIAVICDKVIRPNQGWLQVVIDIRDRINHLIEGGVAFEHFRIRKIVRDGVEHVVVPKWSDEQPVREALEITWRRLMCLCEEFIGFILFLRIKPGLGVAYRHVEDETGDARWAIMPPEKLPAQARAAIAAGKQAGEAKAAAAKAPGKENPRSS